MGPADLLSLPVGWQEWTWTVMCEDTEDSAGKLPLRSHSSEDTRKGCTGHMEGKNEEGQD